MHSSTLENDWLLKTGRLGALFLRYFLLVFAVIAAVIGVLILMAGMVELIAPDTISRVSDDDTPVSEVIGVAAILAVLAPALWLSSRFFALLAQIIATVGEGDPFVAANADRLRGMGVISLLLFAISLAAGLGVFAWTQVYDDTVEELTIDASLESLFLAVLLFILARVFRHGAAMREDLEGTV